MNKNKKIYFGSDFHLGVPTLKDSIKREKLVVDWLERIQNDADSIFLLGDIFDFWFEYKKVVPKGFVRLLGKFAELTDKDIPIHIIKGNHDMWMYDYLPKETGVIIHDRNFILQKNRKNIFLAHGDGLGPGDLKYKLLKTMFTSKLCQWIFARLHPNFGISLAQFCSKKSRSTNNKKMSEFLGEKNEWLVTYCKRKQEENPMDFYIFGHRHLPLEVDIDKNCKYINLGDWMIYQSYAVFDGENIELKYFKSN